MSVDLARAGKIWRDVVRSGEMWDVAPGWPVPHLVWDYAVTILYFIGLHWVSLDFCGFRWMSVDLARAGKIWRDVVRSGEMWDVAPGWPVPHLVWDYAVTILYFIGLHWVSLDFCG